MNREWLAKTVELQGLIEKRSLSLRDAMHLISEQARSSAGASGTAIAILRADELVYEAGSGTAEVYVGRRMIATLSTSTTDQPKAEILRVEDADTDPRIQSAICRQFGARSLLILPLCGDGRLSGVLQISFDQPHKFPDREIQVYRVLAGFAQQAMSLSSQPEHNEIESAVHAPHALVDEGAPMAMIASEGEGHVPSSHLAFLPIFRRVWDAAVAATIIIASTGLVLHSGRSATIMPPATTVPQASNQVEHQAFAEASPPMPQTASSAFVEQTVTAHPSRIRKGLPHSAGHIEYFGDDVTVRYFAPESSVLRTRGKPEIRRLSNDVTVRYLKPGTAPQH